MSNRGIMKQIRDLLLQGKSSRELIDLGYRPGSVYGALRQMRHKDSVKAGHRGSQGLRAAASRRKTTADTLGEDESPDCPIWHVDPALTCPGCGQEVVHWGVCPDCNRLLPWECACTEEGSPCFGKVYSLSELCSSVSGRSLRITEVSP